MGLIMEMPEGWEKADSEYKYQIGDNDAAESFMKMLELIREVAEAAEEMCEEERRYFAEPRGSGPSLTTPKLRLAVKKFKEWK